MTPEQLKDLRINLRRISDRGLIQFLHLVLKEFHRRDPTIPIPHDPLFEVDLDKAYNVKP